MIEDLAFPNSAFVTAPERLMLRGGSMRRVAVPVRYGRFRHPTRGLCLIDTGYTARVTTGDRSVALTLYARLLRPVLTDEALTSGASADTVILTHLHADHIAGLRDLYGAALFAHGASTTRLLALGDLGQRRHGFFPELLPSGFADILTPYDEASLTDTELGPGRDLFGDKSVIAIPLPGHMDGHHGILLRTANGPVLYAGDAQWLRRAVRQDRLPRGPAAWITHDAAAARETAARLAAYEEAGGCVVYCHDPEPPPC